VLADVTQPVMHKSGGKLGFRFVARSSSDHTIVDVHVISTQGCPCCSWSATATAVDRSCRMARALRTLCKIQAEETLASLPPSLDSLQLALRAPFMVLASLLLLNDDPAACPLSLWHLR